MSIQNIDIYATIPGTGEQTWTIWTSDVHKECAKIQECIKEAAVSDGQRNHVGGPELQ